jgi:hypothetical protein
LPSFWTVTRLAANLKTCTMGRFGLRIQGDKQY